MRILLVVFACLALVAADRAEWLKNFPKHEAVGEHIEEVEEPERDGASEEYGTYREVEREGEEEEKREEQEKVEPEAELPTEELEEDEEAPERAVAEEEEDDEEEEEVEVEHHRHHERRHHHRRGSRGGHSRRYPDKPRFCGRSDCPRFRLMKEYRGYELRCYPPYSWVTTKNDVLDSKDFGGMFKRLLAYIKGKNSRKQKLSMKTPVGVTMKYNITDHKTKSMMSFFLSGACCPRCNCDHGPPKPLDPKVFIMRTPEFCAYVRPFDGWVMSRGWSYYKQLWYLTKDLERDGKDKYYAKGLSGFAGYNPPWQLFNRHNEVWRFFKCPHCNKTEGSMEMFKYIQEEVEKENTPVMIP